MAQQTKPRNPDHVRRAVGLGDAVAEELMLPFDRISLEMVFRGLYHFTQVHHRGEAADLRSALPYHFVALTYRRPTVGIAR